MQKSIVKQVIIILLACVAILLALALVLYQYVPSNKVIPSKVEAYSAPENIKAEISESTQQELNGQIEMYEITDSDLDMYKSTKSYNPGKSDPFAPYSENTTSVEDSNATAGRTTEGGSSRGDSSSSKTERVDTNTTDNYYTAANVSRGTK